MWLWLQNKSKISLRNFFKKIFLISLFVHLIVLFFFFFIYKDKILNLNIFLNKDLIENSQIPIVFLPFAKSVPGSIENLKKLNKRKNKLVAKKQNSKNIEKKVPAAKKITVVPKPKINKKTIVIQNKLKNKIKKEEMKLPEVKKEIPKEPEVIKPKEQVLEMPKNEPIVDKKVDEPIAIYLGKDDIQGLQLVQAIQNEITKYWKPPKGIPKGVECIFKIKVDKDGKPTEIKFEKSSKILIYDVSLKNAILKAIMPAELKDRELVLTVYS